MYDYKISHDQYGNDVGTLTIGQREIPFIPLHGLDKGKNYDGLYIIDPSWSKSGPAMMSRLSKELGKKSGNVVYVDFGKEKLDTPSELLDYVGKIRKKDYTDAEVIRSMNIVRMEAANTMRPKFEKCYVFLDRLEKMRGFDENVIVELLDWNCTVFVNGYPKGK